MDEDLDLLNMFIEEATFKWLFTVYSLFSVLN